MPPSPRLPQVQASTVHIYLIATSTLRPVRRRFSVSTSCGYPASTPRRCTVAGGLLPARLDPTDYHNRFIHLDCAIPRPRVQVKYKPHCTPRPTRCTSEIGSGSVTQKLENWLST